MPLSYYCRSALQSTEMHLIGLFMLQISLFQLFEKAGSLYLSQGNGVARGTKKLLGKIP